MIRAPRRLASLVLTLVCGAVPLAAQTTLRTLPTQELYSEARERAAKVSDDCRRGSRTDYLEAMTYLFAYYQVASRDGSLQSAPDFDRTLKQKFLTVLRTVRECLDLVQNSSAGMRDDGTGPKVEYWQVAGSYGL